MFKATTTVVPKCAAATLIVGPIVDRKFDSKFYNTNCVTPWNDDVRSHDIKVLHEIVKQMCAGQINTGNVF